MIDKIELFFQNLDLFFKENQKQFILSQKLSESFLVGLVSARQNYTERELEDRCRSMNIPVRAEFVLIQIDFEDCDPPVSYIYKLLQNTVSEHPVFIYGEHLNILVNGKESFSDKKREEEILSILIRSLPRYKLRLYVSNTFFSLLDLYDAGVLCSQLQQMQERYSLPNKIIRYRDWPELLTAMNMQNTIHLHTLCMPHLIKMQKYDEAYHTQYMETLKKFLEKDCDIKKTAEELELHRNSVAYRIEKIEELFGFDFSDVKMKNLLFWSLQVLQFY